MRMATFCFSEHRSLGAKGMPTAGTWEVALDPSFTQIIDRTVNNPDAIYTWNSPLPKIGEPGYYVDLPELHVRMKLHIHNSVSDWYVLPVVDQRDQQITTTENGVVTKTLNTIKDGIGI